MNAGVMKGEVGTANSGSRNLFILRLGTRLCCLPFQLPKLPWQFKLPWPGNMTVCHSLDFCIFRGNASKQSKGHQIPFQLLGYSHLIED